MLRDYHQFIERLTAGASGSRLLVREESPANDGTA